VNIQSNIDLTDEAAVSRFYNSLPSLWASIHTAGGFAAGMIAETSFATFQTNARHQQRDMLFVLSRSNQENPRHRRRRADRQRQLKARLDSSRWSVRLRREQSCGVIADRQSVRRIGRRKNLGQCRRPSIMDTPINRQMMPKADYDKWAKLSEVAATIAFLASPQNAVTRGALVPVYGRS